ncbi:MAG: 4Fe-4S binding protein [Acidobacteriota bacterium]|jgi:ferredoxin
MIGKRAATCPAEEVPVLARKIIHIDEELCDGCGQCIDACAEGALQLVDGVARLVGDVLCDGFGDCVGECPTGALTIEQRAAAPFDLEVTRAHVARRGGAAAVTRLEDAARAHGPRPRQALPMVPPVQGGCPGSRSRSLDEATAPEAAEPLGGAGPRRAIPSELRQWPVQLHLVQPGASFFRDRELVVLNPCGPVASADVHWRFLRGRSVVVACPKLDDARPYAEKLAAILSEASIPRVLVVRMEVPCCGGLTRIVREAAARSGRGDLAVEEVTLGLNGDLQRVAPA